MAALATNVVPLTGLRIDDKFVSATAGGDDCATGAGVALLIKNGDASSHTVTLVTPGTVNGLAIADRPVVVAAGQEAAVLVDDEYRDPSTGRASITYDAAPATLTVCVIRLPVS
ncbi:hypothetical protein ACFSL4_01780 [Streptomyces caeni]|uniref:DUF2190 family protein n=1 Tax=Streptomyces caeni TaxID=2307231 RepID=A0ABW4IKE3_9ACTN